MEYIRAWWLINRLSGQLIVLNAMNRGLLMGQATPQAHQALALDLEEFLEERAKKYWFGILKIRKLKYTDIRKEKDKKLLQRANNQSLIQIAPNPRKNDGSLVLHLLPDGYYFAQPINGLAGFLKEYKEAFATIILICGVLITWSPIVQAKIHRWYNYLHDQPQEVSRTPR